MTVIAIDGTFASGKGTLGKALARHYDFEYLDTGKLYRAVAQAVLLSGSDVNDAQAATRCAATLDVTDLDDPALKSGPIGAAASKVAVHPGVREALLSFQREFSKKTLKAGAVLDGRDIGTVICPDATVKLYVDAAQEQRAERRHQELLGYGETLDYQTVLAQLKERDARDSGRANAPLTAAKDAHLVDTTDQSIAQVFASATAIIDAVFAVKRGDGSAS